MNNQFLPKDHVQHNQKVATLFYHYVTKIHELNLLHLDALTHVVTRKRNF